MRQRVFANTHVLGIGTTVYPRIASDDVAEYFITRFETSHPRANRLDQPRHVGTRNTGLRPERSGGQQAEGVGPPGHDVPDIGMHRGRTNSHQHLVRLDHGPFDFSEFQHIQGAVPVLDDRLHRVLLLRVRS